MGLFDRFKKKKQAPPPEPTEEELKNLVFMVHLLMEEKTPLPSRERMEQVLSRHLGDTECFSYDEKLTAFSVKKHMVQLSDGEKPVELMISESLPMADFTIDADTRRQMWDCPEHEEILAACPYHIFAMDLMADLMPYKDRANMDMDFLEALVELFPECRAVYIQNSGKMFTREKVEHHDFSGEDRFIHFAVNARYFTIADSDEQIVDTLGMGLLGLPDVQYHFRGYDVNAVVYHAYNVALYICGGEKRIEHGDHIDGLKDGEFDVSVQWGCHHENAMLRPERVVVDICMNEYAAGNRDYDKK